MTPAGPSALASNVNLAFPALSCAGLVNGSADTDPAIAAITAEPTARNA